MIDIMDISTWRERGGGYYLTTDDLKEYLRSQSIEPTEENIRALHDSFESALTSLCGPPRWFVAAADDAK